MGTKTTNPDQKNSGPKPKREMSPASLANLTSKGRPKGSPNKATGTLKSIARQYTDEALKVLYEVMKGSDSDASRVAAANSLLDRGYGKPSQVLSGDEDGGAIQTVSKIILEGVQPK